MYIIARVFIVFLIDIFISHTLSAQSRLVIADDACIVISNAAFLVLDNSIPSALTFTGSGGNIISEGEFNIVKWNIGSNTGLYTIPFSKTISEKIPLSVNIINSGSMGGSIAFSTYGGATWDNLNYMPSDVSHMNSFSGANNSAFVIDRFWIIDAKNYITKPECSISFTYLDSEWNQPGNTITEASFFAQRFNPTPFNLWGDWFGSSGTANILLNTVNSGFISNTNLHRSWTLADQASPLPIELSEFSVECLEVNKRLFKWTTLSEVNNQYFIVQASHNGLVWEDVIHIEGAGNSSSVHSYMHIVDVNSNIKYFRLKQIDFDGNFTYSNIILSKCIESVSPQLSIYPNPNNGIFFINVNNFNHSDIFTLEIFNSIGQIIQNQALISGINSVDMSNKKNGIYFINIKSSNYISKYKIIKTF